MTFDRDSGDGHETVDVIGCSVRGEKSEAKEIPCQDDNERRQLPGRRYVIVAADGLGSATHSHVGSRVATQAVADYVEEAVTGVESLNEEALRSVLREAFVHAREQLHKVANSRGTAVSDLNTTLLVAVGGPAGVGGAAVGDGGVVWHRGGRTGLLVPREDTEYGNQTIPVQSSGWEDSYRFGWMPDADAAAVFSDGIDAVAWDGPTSVSDDLFDQVFDNVREFSNTDRLERFLEDFLDGEALRQSSRDDKTLVVGALPGSEWADPAETELHESPVEDRHDEETAATGSTSRTETDDESSETAAHEAGDDIPDSTGDSSPTISRPRKAKIDEQLGDNGTRRIAVTVGIVVVVLSVVLGAALLTGQLLGSDGSEPGQFEVTTQSATDAVEGNNLAVTVEIKNTGNTEQTQTIELDVRELGSTGTEVTVSGGNVTNETLTLTTGAGDSGNYTVNVSSANETASTNVTVLAPAEFTVGGLETNTPIEGEKLTVTAQVTNIGDVEATRTVELAADGLEGNQTEVTLAGGESQTVTLSVPTEAGDQTEVTLAGGESRTVTLSVPTEAGDAGKYTPTVSTESDAADTGVMVLPPANFTVRITNTNTPVEGENLTVTAQIANEGDNRRTQTAKLSVESLGRNSTNVTLDGGNTTETTLNLTTEVGDANDYTATVSSANGTDSTKVSVGEAGQLSQAELLDSTGDSARTVRSATSFGRNGSEQRPFSSDQHFAEWYTRPRSYRTTILTNAFSGRAEQMDHNNVHARGG
jgi:hypothetical protein